MSTHAIRNVQDDGADPGPGMAYKIVFEYLGGHGDVGLFWRSDQPSPLKGAAHLPFSLERLLTVFSSAGDNTAQVSRDHHRFDLRSSNFKTRFQLAVSQAPEGSEYDYALLLRNVMSENGDKPDDRIQPVVILQMTFLD